MESKIPGLKFTNVWSSDHADQASNEYGGHKNLAWIWDQGIFSPSTTFLIDDHPNLISAATRKRANGKTEHTDSKNIRNVFNIPAFVPEDDSMVDDDGLLMAMAELQRAMEGNTFCVRYSRLPKPKKKGGLTKRSKGLRRKTSRR
jgi:hypothetical protein